MALEVSLPPHCCLVTNDRRKIMCLNDVWNRMLRNDKQFAANCAITGASIITNSDWSKLSIKYAGMDKLTNTHFMQERNCFYSEWHRTVIWTMKLWQRVKKSNSKVRLSVVGCLYKYHYQLSLTDWLLSCKVCMPRQVLPRWSLFTRAVWLRLQ